MSIPPETRNAACHCGTVRFTVTLTEGLNTARRCSCSFCRMRGAVAVTAPLDGVQIIQGEEALTLYQFNTHVAKHYFCGVCGIYTHHQRRSNPNELGVNAACLDGVSPFDFAEVVVMPGGAAALKPDVVTAHAKPIRQVRLDQYLEIRAAWVGGEPA